MYTYVNKQGTIIIYVNNNGVSYVFLILNLKPSDSQLYTTEKIQSDWRYALDFWGDGVKTDGRTSFIVIYPGGE